MAEIPAHRLIAAARGLMLAGQWAQASELLACASAGQGEEAVLAVAEADVAVDQDFWCRTSAASAVLPRACDAVAAAGDQACLFDLEFTRLKHDYNTELTGPDGGEPRRGPEGRDPAVLDDLTGRADALVRGAPDQRRLAWAAFYAGLIADVLRGDDDTGRSRYDQALEAGEAAGDGLIVSYALRHLGFLAGDEGLTRQLWQRSKELRQRAGCVPLVLAQQLALAELAGDAAVARAIADEVSTWSRALGGTWLEPAAADLLS